MSAMTHWNGLAAEDIAERQYLSKGYRLLEKRWRSDAGEIDLIVRDDEKVVFVEVKARRTHETAAFSISQKQWMRIMASAEIYLAEKGVAPTTDLRFDAALVDRTGICEIVENAPVF